MYRTLRADKIVATLDTLSLRISERFAGSGLAQVAAELGAVARAAAAQAERLSKPYAALRLLSMLALALGIAAQIALVTALHPRWDGLNIIDFTQGLDAAVNLLILMGGAVWFLITIEVRVKRARALAALHELRSLAHVIDMHQLTKDPTVILAAHHHPTPASPVRAMSEFELARYLDYCAEMLALIGKLAALYAAGARDSVVIDAVNEIENLTANLGRKIWQKIMILSQLDEDTRAPSS